MKKIIIISVYVLVTSVYCVSASDKTADNTEKTGIGVIVNDVTNIEDQLADLKKNGFVACQLGFNENYDQATATRLIKASTDNQIQLSTLICGTGDAVWNFLDGPATIGLVPRTANRQQRIQHYRKAIDFAALAHIPAIHSHFGFIPENPRDEIYIEFIKNLKELAIYAKAKGVDIYFETGQETPVTLIRTIQDVGTGNLFINCDLANLVMYGKANALDAVKMFGSLIKEFHAKDGLYPAQPYELGKEVNIPEGEVNFPAVLTELKKQKFDGLLIIEREFGTNQREYLIKTKKYLEELMAREE